MSESEASQAKKQQRAAEARQREAKRRLEAMRAVMYTEDGRAFVWSLLEECHLQSSIFSAEPTRLAYLEGQRSVAAQLVKKLQVEVPLLYVQMVAEAHARLSTPAE